MTNLLDRINQLRKTCRPRPTFTLEHGRAGPTRTRDRCSTPTASTGGARSLPDSLGGSGWLNGTPGTRHVPFSQK